MDRWMIPEARPVVGRVMEDPGRAPMDDGNGSARGGVGRQWMMTKETGWIKSRKDNEGDSNWDG